MGQVRPHHLGKVLRNFRGRQAAACRGRGGIHAPTTKIFQALQHDFFEFCKLYPSYWTFLVVSCLCCKIVKNVGSNELHHITSCRKTFGSSTNKEIDLFLIYDSIHIPSIFHIVPYHSISILWEAGTLHLRGLVFGDYCAVGENAAGASRKDFDRFWKCRWRMYDCMTSSQHISTIKKTQKQRKKRCFGLWDTGTFRCVQLVVWLETM